MATSASRADSIELESIPNQNGSANATPAAPSVSGESTQELTPAEASRMADAEVPEGGYGWVAVTGCSIVTFFFAGTSYSWGVLQASLVESGLSSAATLSFVGSTTVTCIAALALVNARLLRLIGARKTALLGIFLLGLGGILSGQTTKSIGGLFVTSGVVGGFGTSLCFMVSSVVPSQYFVRKRGLANGVVYAGGGLGGTIISFSLSYMLENLGTAWTFRTLGLITWLVGLPAAWVIKERVPIRGNPFIDWRLFRDPRFTILFLTGAVATFPLFVPPFFLPLYGSSLGLSSSGSAALVAGFNFASALGRLSFGFFCDTVGPINSLFTTLLLSGLSMLVIWPVSNSIGPLVLFTIISGAANGGFFSAMPTVVGSIFGSTRVPVSMGMIVTGWVGGYLMGAPIAGYLLAAYGGGKEAQHTALASYHPAMFYAGSMALGAAGLVALIRVKMGGTKWKKV